MDWSLWANEAQVFSAVATIAVGTFGLYRRIEKKQVKFDQDLALIRQRLDYIVMQFGPNGGGIRQAVNEMSDKLSNIESRQIDIGDKVAELDGRFKQHIKESNE